MQSFINLDSGSKKDFKENDKVRTEWKQKVNLLNSTILTSEDFSNFDEHK